MSFLNTVTAVFTFYHWMASYWRHKWTIFPLNDVKNEHFLCMTSQVNHISSEWHHRWTFPLHDVTDEHFLWNRVWMTSPLYDVTIVWRHHYNRWNFRCVFQPRSGTKPWALPGCFLQELEVRSFLPYWSWPNQDERTLRKHQVGPDKVGYDKVLKCVVPKFVVLESSLCIELQFSAEHFASQIKPRSFIYVGDLNNEPVRASYSCYSILKDRSEPVLF